jgi:hypothetical protein
MDAEQIAGWLKTGHERGLRALGFEPGFQREVQQI